MISKEDRKALSLRGYETVRMLGEGAFSKVVLVRDQVAVQWRQTAQRQGSWQAGRYIACKISSRFDLTLREADILSKIDHPLFPEYRGVWEEEGKVYLLMEYICGSNLEELLARRGSFSDAQAVRIGLELAEGLKYLHELQGAILFRDLKPANILVRQDGRVKLLDLGCACGTGEQANIAGTPGYAAPEQLKSGSFLTPAIDVYGLGKILQVIAGKGCGKRLERVITACIREQPRERIADMRGVISALAVLDAEGRKLGLSGGFTSSQAVCLNNIWESAHKGY